MIRSFLSRPWFWLFGNPRPPAHADTPVLDLGIIVSRGCVIKVRGSSLQSAHSCVKVNMTTNWEHGAQESNRRTQSQHAATIVEVQPGELLAAWFGGSWERNHDVSIWVSKFKVRCGSVSRAPHVIMRMLAAWQVGKPAHRLSHAAEYSDEWWKSDPGRKSIPGAACCCGFHRMDNGLRRRGRLSPRQMGHPHGTQCSSR